MTELPPDVNVPGTDLGDDGPDGPDIGDPGSAPGPHDGAALLFGDPAPEVSRSGAEGVAALWSEGPRRPGTAVIECSHCDVRTRVDLVDAGVRLASLSVLNPFRRHPHRLVCPACAERTWCRIDWTA